VNVRFLDLEMVHQLEDVHRSTRAVGLRLVAFAVIAIVDGNNPMILRERRSNSGSEPHALRRIRVAVYENNPRARGSCVR
jgi:hypothetical protein